MLPATFPLVCCGANYVAVVPNSGGRRGVDEFLRNIIFDTAHCKSDRRSSNKETRSCSKTHTWFGHSKLDTISIYAGIDLEMKVRAIPSATRPNRPWKEKKELTVFLKSL